MFGWIVRRRIAPLLGGCGLVLASVLAASGPASAGSGPTACVGGLASGSYGKVVVPAGATCIGDGPVSIAAGLFVQPGATFVLGSEESPGSTGSISGGVHATDAASVRIHFARIKGGLEIRGGSGPFGGPFGITWNAIEDNEISGGVTVNGYDGFWFGFIRNEVDGSVSLDRNTLVDPDGNEYVTNSIHGSLGCVANSPAPQIGDSEGSPNTVSGAKTGQCAGL
jgi:hypothetical protein